MYRLRQGSCHLLDHSLAGGARLFAWVRQEMLSWGLVRSFLQMCLSKLPPRFGLGRKWEAPVRPPDLSYGFQTSFLQSTLHVGIRCQQHLSRMLIQRHLALVPCPQLPPMWVFLGSCSQTLLTAGPHPVGPHVEGRPEMKGLSGIPGPLRS